MEKSNLMFTKPFTFKNVTEKVKVEVIANKILHTFKGKPWAKNIH